MDRRELKRLLELRGLRPRRAWSQNFLIDEQVAGAIVSGARPQGEAVVELGAGLGVLTSKLARLSRILIAVEKDARLAEVLRDQFSAEPQVEILEENAARMDFSAWREKLQARLVVVGNLPYHMAAPILFRLLESSEHLLRWVIMLQKEMADRVLAGPGQHGRGVLGLMVENRASAERLLDVEAEAFYPPPRVRSSVLRFTPWERPRLSRSEEAWFRRTVKAAFSRRRKKIRNSLLGLVQQAALLDACLQEAAIEEERRPEELSFENFANLSRLLAQKLGWTGDFQ